jgi:phage N-6-adenine-methyltransferase
MSTATATRLFDNIIEFPRPAQEGSKSNEWYTPARYIEAAREVMGGIDLDPASCELANRTVRAKRYYSKEDNGLSKEWYGRVWLNPPYGKAAGIGYIGLWITKAIEASLSGEIEEAIILTTGDIDTRWFQRLLDYPVCLSKQGVSFLEPTSDGIAVKGKYHSHIFGSAFTYLGLHEQKFIEVFSQFGRIAKAIDTPRQTVRPLSLWEEVAL